MRAKSLLGTLLLGAGLIWQNAAASGLQAVNPPTPMPAFKAASLSGNTSDTDLRNKVTVIRFWASW